MSRIKRDSVLTSSSLVHCIRFKKGFYLRLRPFRSQLNDRYSFCIRTRQTTGRNEGVPLPDGPLLRCVSFVFSSLLFPFSSLGYCTKRENLGQYGLRPGWGTWRVKVLDFDLTQLKDSDCQLSFIVVRSVYLGVPSWWLGPVVYLWLVSIRNKQRRNNLLVNS